MKALASGVIFFLCAATVLAQLAPDQQAREELKLGVQAYKSAEYDEAIQHFQRAALLDENSCVARLYLATTYAQLYVPGVDGKDNVAMATQAIDQYRATLKCDPRKVNAMKGIAFLNMQLKKFEEARQGYSDALKLDGNDAELYYSVGVIDWTEAYKNMMETRARYSPPKDQAEANDKDDNDGDNSADDDDADDDDTSSQESAQNQSDSSILPDDLLNLSPVCPELRSRNLPLVEDGIQMLSRAMELRKDYDDAMAYMNLLYRQRAEIECGDTAASVADIKKANDWSDLALAARKKKLEAAEKCMKAAGGASTACASPENREHRVR